jgi:excisionase family DNA binding protein
MSAALVAAIEKLTERIARLEKAARQPERQAYKVAEVAAMFGCESQSVRDMIHNGRLRAEDMGGWYLIPRTEVENLLAAKENA